MSQTIPILVGSYSNVITTLAFSPASGTLSVTGTTAAGNSPSWLARHPSDRTLIVASNEDDPGKVVLFRVTDETRGTLELVQSVGSAGRHPAHLWVGEGEVVAANYSSGTLLTIPLDTTSSPPTLGEPTVQLTCDFPGVGPDPGRQEASHPHQVYAHPSGEELLVPDLGSDKVWRLARAGIRGGWEVKGAVDVKAGDGPRHVVVKDDVLYVLNELTNSLSAYSLPPLGDTARPVVLKNVSTLVPPTEAAPGMLAAEILLSTSPEPLLYVSNRNEPHPNGDAITIFTPAGADLAMVSGVRTGLKHLRALTFGGEGDKYVMVGGLNGGGIKVYERVDGGRALREVAHLEEGVVEKPTSFVML